jgi:uncharacterized protein YjaG (DUF416 family)
MPTPVRHLQCRAKYSPTYVWTAWNTFELEGEVENGGIYGDPLDRVWDYLESGWDKVTLKSKIETIQYRLPRP